MAKRIYTQNNYIILDTDNGEPLFYLAKKSTDFNESTSSIRMFPSGTSSSALGFTIKISDIPNWFDEAGATAYTKETLIDFLTSNTGFSQGGSSPVTTTNFGFMDYNHDGASVALTADTWIDVPNNGLGAFTNKAYKPSLINEVIDVSTGYLDFSELTLGSQIMVRNDFTVTPNTNNSLLEARYLLGSGAGQYALQFLSERLDSGSGIGYQRVTSFPIYMGDVNTQGNAGILQIKLSTSGAFVNSGSYIDIKIK